MHSDIIDTRDSGNVLSSVVSPKETILNVSYWWLIIISVLLRWLPFVFSTTSSFIDLKRVCMVLSYLFLLFALWRNIRFWGARILAIGTFLNFLAIITNHGFMPVSPGARYLAGKSALNIQNGITTLTGSGGVIMPVAQTKLWILTDIIPIAPLHTVFSIGDIILILGLIFVCISFIFFILKKTNASVTEKLEAE